LQSSWPRMHDSGIEFPPQSGHPEGVGLLVEAYACVVSGRTAWYVSSPLTSGKRSREWRRRNAERVGAAAALTSENFTRDVLAPNRKDAARFVETLRARQNQVVIDPVALADIPDWKQSDYQVLWARVIERYVATVVFREGWQVSNGCAWELLTAYLADCRLLREDLSPLEMPTAQALLETTVSAPDGSPAFLVAVLDALKHNRRNREWRAPN